MAKVTGIGGVFIKCKGDSKALSAWYAENLGIDLEPWGGAILKWSEDRADDGGMTVWNLAAPGNDWFEGPAMINYRVDNLAEMLEQLRNNGVDIKKGPESHENGKFAWIADPEGNPVELWEAMAWDDKNKEA